MLNRPARKVRRAAKSPPLVLSLLIRNAQRQRTFSHCAGLPFPDAFSSLVTFDCDFSYSDSPTASRASDWSM